MSTSTFWYLDYRPGAKGGTFVRATTATELRDVLAVTAPTVRRPMFGHPIHSDGGTLSGGSWQATLPLTNLQDRRRSKKARSTDATNASTKWDDDLGDTYPLGAVVLDAHNLTTDARVRVRVSDESDFDPAVFDSGWVDALPEVYPSGLLSPGEPGFLDGKPTSTQLGDADYKPPPAEVFLPAGVEGRYVRVEIDDTGNGDGYVEVGRYLAVTTFQPNVNFKPGAELGLRTSSEAIELDGGARYHVKRARRRLFGSELHFLTEDAAMVRFHDFYQLVGTTRQFWFWLDPTATYHRARGSYLAVLDALSPLNFAWSRPNKRLQPVAVVEEL